MVTVERHERLIPECYRRSAPTPASTMRPRCERSSWIRSAAAGPLMQKRSSERSASICDSLQRVAHVNRVSTMYCQPWPNGSFPHCPGISTPNKWPGLLTPVARTGSRGGGTVRSYCCCFGWGSARATLPACARLISTGRMPRCWCEARDAGMSVYLYHRMQETRFWTTLEHARPQVAIDRVFLCAKAPFRPSDRGMIVSGIVRAALRRAGIENPPTHGANLLRHSTATMMLRAGATLDEIGTVLRHKSPDTTAHYAKVDVAALQQIAQPWPKEGRSC